MVKKGFNNTVLIKHVIKIQLTYQVLLLQLLGPQSL